MAKPRYKSCNPDLLKSLRERLHLTQADLAKAAGYTERLIVKAESGATLSRETIQDLAAALSTAEEPIYEEDLTSDPIGMARAYIEALYAHQKDIVAHIRHFLDEDVVFIIPGDPEHIPFAGRYQGFDVIHAGYQLFFSLFEAPPNHDPTPHYQYVAQGMNVVVWGRSFIHPIGRPLVEPMPVCNLMKFRRGKLYSFEDQYDTQRTAALIQQQLVAGEGRLASDVR